MSVSRELPQGDVVVLVGNPAPGSRTSAVARAVAAGLAAEVDRAVEVVELADLGATGVSAGDDRVRRAREAVTGASLLVVATPVHKAGYTGLLKLFLDTFEPTALESTVTVPVVLTASSAHGALADLQLRVVLQAVGAVLPVPSFVLEEHHLDHLAQYVDSWQRRFLPAVTAVAHAVGPEAVLR